MCFPLPVFSCQLRKSQRSWQKSYPAWTHFLDINNAKMKLADEDNLNVYFSTIDEELKYNGEPAGSPDIYHYDSSSMIKLGNIFAQKIVENFLDL